MISTYKNAYPQVDKSSYIAPGAQVIGMVELMQNTSVWHNAVLRGDVDKIIIGENSNVQDLCAIHCTKGIPVVVGKNVTIGHSAVLHSCTIGDNSLIGMGAIILDGVEIGQNCLIGAGALVTPRTKIPDNSVVLGSPAKVVKQTTEEQIKASIENAMEYVKLSKEYKLVKK